MNDEMDLLMTKLVTYLNIFCIFVVTNYNNVSFFR